MLQRSILVGHCIHSGRPEPPAKVPTISKLCTCTPTSKPTNELGTSIIQFYTGSTLQQRNLLDRSRRSFQKKRRKKERKKRNSRNSAQVGGTHNVTPVKRKAQTLSFHNSISPQPHTVVLYRVHAKRLSFSSCFPRAPRPGTRRVHFSFFSFFFFSNSCVCGEGTRMLRDASELEERSFWNLNSMHGQ